MLFTFEINVDKPNNMLLNKITGFCASLNEYTKWEQAFSQIWQKNFGEAKVKILSDQRGFKPVSSEVIERITILRKQTQPHVIATATVVDDIISKMQMKRVSHAAGFDEIEEFFTDYNDALEWLKNR